MPEDMNKLIGMQKELMEKVPHGVRRDVYAAMMCVRDLMEKSLLFLTSLGHKPWRPDPLSPEEQKNRLADLYRTLRELIATHGSDYITPLEEEEYQQWTRKLISGFGIIEETLEYLDSVGRGNKPHELEEITDILFFYLELMIQSGFTWDQIKEEYVRKHAENLERYKKAKEGDYSWDKRSEGAEL